MTEQRQQGFPDGAVVKDLCANAGGAGSIPRFYPQGNGNSVQYSYLENSVDKRSLVGSSPRSHKELDMTGHTCIDRYRYRPCHEAFGILLPWTKD